MACKNVCSLCPRLILSTAVNFDAATNALLINIPSSQGGYLNKCKYCIVVAQPIPDTVTRNALVFITITGSTERFPLVDTCCQQVGACNISSRTKYATIVQTNSVSGVFRLCQDIGKCGVTPVPSLPVAPVVTGVVPLSLRETTTTRTAKTTTKKEVVENE